MIFSKKIGKNTFSSHFRHITSSENWKSGFETPHCDNTAAGHPSRTPSDFANFFPTHNGSHNVQRRTTRFCPKIGKNENGKNAVFPKKNQHITSSLRSGLINWPENCISQGSVAARRKLCFCSRRGAQWPPDPCRALTRRTDQLARWSNRWTWRGRHDPSHCIDRRPRGCRAAGAAAPGNLCRGNCPLAWACMLWLGVSV